MGDNYSLTGNYGTTPLNGVGSLDPDISAPINESLVLAKKSFQTVTLGADAPEVVSFGDLTGANVVMLKAVEGKVKALVTSSDGSAQAIPFDTYLILMSMSVPITAISLVRTPSLSTQVRVFLGEKA